MMMNFMRIRRSYPEQSTPSAARAELRGAESREKTEEGKNHAKPSPMGAFVLISLGIAFLADSFSAHNLFLPVFFLGLGLGTLLKDRF